jgi:hypothetical protein
LVEVGNGQVIERLKFAKWTGEKFKILINGPKLVAKAIRKRDSVGVGGHYRCREIEGGVQE